MELCTTVELKYLNITIDINKLMLQLHKWKRAKAPYFNITVGQTPLKPLMQVQCT